MVSPDLLAWTPLISFVLAVVGTAAYVLGRRSNTERFDPKQIWLELRRARFVMQDAERVLNSVRMDLATHQMGILDFKERLATLSKSQTDHPIESFSDEADRILKPTIELSDRIAHTYDEIRHQANLLVSFTEARTDPLTGLDNRRGLEELLKTLFAMFYRYKRTFSIAVFDLDHFKRINDEHGHAYGDQILRGFADTVSQSIREMDRITRFGSEEFVLIMPETDLEGASLLCTRICQAVQQTGMVTVSVGVAEVCTADTMKSLIGRADSAVYSAKAAGRDCVYRHDGDSTEVAFANARNLDKTEEVSLGTPA